MSFISMLVPFVSFVTFGTFVSRCVPFVFVPFVLFAPFVPACFVPAQKMCRDRFQLIVVVNDVRMRMCVIISYVLLCSAIFRALSDRCNDKLSNY